MDNRNTLIGTMLIGLLLMIFLIYTSNKQKENLKNKRPNSGQVASEPKITAPEQKIPAITSSEEPQKDSLISAELYGPFASSIQGKAENYILENEVQKIVVSSKGGFIQSIELKKYKTWDGKPVVLFNDKNTRLSYQFIASNNQIINTADLYFTPQQPAFSVNGSEKKTFILRAFAGDGYIEQSYTIEGKKYLIDYRIKFNKLEDELASNNTFISATWNSILPVLEKDLPTERRYSALYFKFKDSDVSHLKDDGNEEQNITTPLSWISFKQQFFNTTFISKKGEIKTAVLKTAHADDEKGYVKKYNANFTLPFRSSEQVIYDLAIYAGPNHYKTLAGIGYEFEDILKLGPDFFLFAWIKYITRFIIWVFGLFDSTGLNYGIIILIMTIFLKIILHPLTYKSYKSAASMKLLQPELNELKEKYGDDQARLGQEQMKLYQRAGVSPFGGCIPLLLQMPILMAMYYFFPASIELRQQPFLWANDLSSYDAIVTFSASLPLIGNHISLFTVLMTITSIIQAVMNRNMNQMGQQQPGMQYLPYIMPVMLMFIFNSFPAALTYYYLLQNLIGMGQQWIIQKFFIDENKLRKQIEENKKNPRPKSAFQKKLEELQRQAAQNQKRR